MPESSGGTPQHPVDTQGGASGEEHYRILFEMSPDALYVFDTDGAIFDANQVAVQRYGYSRDELLRMSVRDLAAPDLRPHVADRLEKALMEGIKFEWRHRCKDGREIPVEIAIRPMVIGGRRCALSISRDVSERKEAETALRARELAFRTVADFTHDWEYWLSPEGKVIYCSPSCERITGHVPGEFQCDPSLLVTIVHADDRERFQEHLRMMLSDGVDNHELDFRIVTRQGQERWLGHVCQPVHGGGGEYLGRRASNRDVTVRKRTEGVLQARLRLRECALSHGLDDLLQETLDQAERLTGSTIGFYHFLEPDQRTLSLQMWSTNTLERMCTAEGKGQHYNLDAAGVWVECVLQRRPIIHNDYASLPHRKGMPPGHAQVTRELVVPVFRDDMIVAILGMGNKPSDYGPIDVETVSLLADLAWDIVEHTRAEERLRQQLSELQRWHDATLGREARIQEMKCEVNQLCLRLGEAVRYPSQGG